MIYVMAFLVAGLGLAYLSQYNSTPVTVHFGAYVLSEIPLFYVMLASLLAGVVLAYAMHVLPAVINALKLRGKDKEIRENKDEVLELTKRVHKLELENEKLKVHAELEPKDRNAL